MDKDKINKIKRIKRLSDKLAKDPASLTPDEVKFLNDISPAERLSGLPALSKEDIHTKSPEEWPPVVRRHEGKVKARRTDDMVGDDTTPKEREGRNKER